MKNKFIKYSTAATLTIVLIFSIIYLEGIAGLLNKNTNNNNKTSNMDYKPPAFYRGIYLSNNTACNPRKFDEFLSLAEKSHINTFVIDVQTSKYIEQAIPATHITECINRRIHPVARVVVFPGGLSSYPPSSATIDKIIDIAERAAKSGFKEIQYDYIRFSDEKRHNRFLRNVSLQERHAFIEKFLSSSNVRLARYNIKIAADIFGRIPHNNNDSIGQNMEVFDRHVDIICPMAYPSHYWTKKLRNDPYGTVLWTSSEAHRRTKKAEIVTWIQAFKMQHPVGMSFEKYVQHQIMAVHDAGVKGFLLWNARQDYTAAFKAVTEFYSSRNDI